MSHELVYEVLVGEVLLDTGIRQYTGEIPALRSYCFADTLLQLRQVVSGSVIPLHTRMTAKEDAYRRLQAEQQIQDVLSFYEEEGLELPCMSEAATTGRDCQNVSGGSQNFPSGPHTCVAKSCTCLSGTVTPS